MMKDFNPENKEEAKENMQEKFSSISSISVDNIKKYADSDYVESYYYTMKVGVNANDLEKASMTSNSDNNNT